MKAGDVFTAELFEKLLEEEYQKLRNARDKDVFDILKPGGVFLNLEHVASPNSKIEKLFDEAFVDGLYAYHVRTGGKETRQDIANKFYNREDKVLNKLTIVEKQVDWLRDIGYINTDCFFKLFELALFGGQKPI